MFSLEKFRLITSKVIALGTVLSAEIQQETNIWRTDSRPILCWCCVYASKATSNRSPRIESLEANRFSLSLSGSMLVSNWDARLYIYLSRSWKLCSFASNFSSLLPEGLFFACCYPTYPLYLLVMTIRGDSSPACAIARSPLIDKTNSYS